ncbi:4-hydroxy-tetrahydrodipicolinate synthase [Candidatus Formimonas warabiya]|uniref:4-hydroxy-tetrahydrodipicolinate synthase n=1 Tax=Formimonas warabiya TaxID=1761012 RepID=A0A3G1KM03_FORW1|nr:4-hydroxy-tetrahydrodipicolinate synthase [Candidatus Formimonas warabiya]ATW23463.1 4-hydroxy-tetrahydrodipicolinate synthase [Candidatus Formimonas warabiya]
MTTSAQLREQMKGVQSIVITPFKEDFSLDIEGLKQNLERMINFGSNGMVIGGSLGEFSSMTMEERKLIFKIAVDTVKSRIPVVCNVSDSYIERTIQLAKYAKEIGADGVMCTPPYYQKVSEEGMYQFYKALNDAVDIGIMAYNTSRSGNHMTPKFIARIAEIPNVVACKQGTRDIEELEETVYLAGDKITLICGSEVMAVPCLAMGYKGTTSTSSSFMTEMIVAMYKATQEGDYKKAADIYFNGWGEYRRFLKKGGMPATAKAAMNILGIPAGPTRLPFLELSDDLKKELKGILERMGLLK